MSLTLGPGPLATRPSGGTNYAIEGPPHRLLFQDHPRRVRALLAGRTVLDSVRGKLLHESNILPRLYVPFEDLDAAVLERSEHTTHCPFKGDASYWSLRVGGELRENAVWAYEDPIETAAWLRGYASVYPDRVDTWLEEDEVVQGFRDPYHRVDARASSRPVSVVADGVELARSERPTLVFETSVPPRVYVPREDVRAELEATGRTTRCPYKGSGPLFSVAGLTDAAWAYDEPLPDGPQLAGLVGFAHDGIEVRLG